MYSQSYQIRYLYRGVEQLVARRAHNPKVVSSSLAPATKMTHRFQIGESFFMGVSRVLGITFYNSLAMINNT